MSKTILPTKSPQRLLSEAERHFSEPLLLHTLQLREWLHGRQQEGWNGTLSAAGPLSIEAAPSRWCLTAGWQPRPWQIEAREAWFHAEEYKGTMKVVTGAGKTALSLFIAERLQQQVDQELRVVVVVPTIVLLNQWYETLLARSNLPPARIGRMGGGHDDDFSNDRRIVIAVLASARKSLQDAVRSAGIGAHLLLIADECHRFGAPEMSAVLRTERAYTLGLSATPERDGLDEDGFSADNGYDASQLGQQLGPVVYELTVGRAAELGILPPFSLKHYGLSLKGDELSRYERLTRSIRDVRAQIRELSPPARKAGGGDSFLQWCRRIAAKADGDIGKLAARYVQEIAQRKQLLYAAPSRRAATLALLQAEPNARAILFHESIREVEALYDELCAAGILAVLEHSGLPSSMRESSLELFRSGQARVIVSARALIEGFDVPAADLGIIVASSSSSRQRIQSIGRVLRKQQETGGEQKHARICVLYIRGTVDEGIYEKEDWGEIIGIDRNLYFTWDPPSEPALQDGPPRAAVPSEMEINLNDVLPGGVYPGRYEGTEFSCDTQGNVLDTERNMAANPQGVPEIVASLKGSVGRFKVTSQKRALLVLRPEEEGWSVLFGGILGEPFRFQNAMTDANEGVFEPAQLLPGKPYPGPVSPGNEFWYRQKRGGVISKRIAHGEVYARGRSAEQLVSSLRQITQEHGPISRFQVNRFSHAIFWRAGTAYFIVALKEPLDFPDSA